MVSFLSPVSSAHAEILLVSSPTVSNSLLNRSDRNCYKGINTIALIGQIVIRMGADTRPLISGLNRGQDAVSRFVSQANGMAGGAGMGAAALAGGVAGLASAGGGAALGLATKAGSAIIRAM